MKAQGVLLTFLHDIGLIGTTERGCESHPVVAATEDVDLGSDEPFAAQFATDTDRIGNRVLAKMGKDADLQNILQFAVP